MAIVALTVLLFLSIALLSTSQATREFAVRQRAEALATNLADAGLEHAVQVVEAGGTIPSQMALDLTGMRVPPAGALVTMSITPEQYGWFGGAHPKVMAKRIEEVHVSWSEDLILKNHAVKPGDATE